MCVDFHVGVTGIKLLQGLREHFGKTGGGLGVQGAETWCQKGQGHGAVGTEEVIVDEVESAYRTLQHIAKHHVAQVERVVHDGLGDVARLVFHHLFIVDPHLFLDGLWLKGFLEVLVGRGVDERGDMLQHEIQCVDSGFGFHFVKHIAYVMARRVFFVQ